MDAVEILIHPVRLRIIYALAKGRILTSTQLLERMPEVSKATLYRHVALLAQEGVLAVVGEQRVRGAVERRYQLREDRAVVTRDAAARMTDEDHRRAFSAAVAALLAEFNAYLTRPGSDPIADSIGYRQFTLWLSPEELALMIEEVRAAIFTRARNEPAPGRRAHLLSTIFFPIETESNAEQEKDSQVEASEPEASSPPSSRPASRGTLPQ